jgi:hypothetical protein
VRIALHSQNGDLATVPTTAMECWDGAGARTEYVPLDVDAQF